LISLVSEIVLRDPPPLGVGSAPTTAASLVVLPTTSAAPPDLPLQQYQAARHRIIVITVLSSGLP
jgi:hypothetical protein